MKKFWPFLLLLLPILLALALPRFIGGDKEDPVLVVQCTDPVKGCQVPLREGAAEVRFMSAPSPLKPFELMVKAPGARQIVADFAMQDMNMGRNRYALQRMADGAWHGNIVLPVCVSGSSRWILTLELDGVKRQIFFVATRQ
ncbi:MAG TPA: hypothetical protein VMV75_01280 [Sulfuricella sp.]|nr:hypothetical protein [Sulfuricella sp.]